jgi:hypothetical protein
MAESSLSTSTIFLVIICGLIVSVSLIINFTLWITLVKLRRLRHTDKSNYFLTNLIFTDFLFTCLICVPSGYGVYNDRLLTKVWCHIQTYFQTLSLLITFHGLLILSIDRYVKFKKPELHVRLFSTEAQPSSLPACLRVTGVLLFMWIVDIILAFIPLYGNFNDLKYYSIQSQCDYTYENFIWWLWLLFIGFITVPFLLSILFYALTMNLVRKFNQKIRFNERSEQIDRVINLSPGYGGDSLTGPATRKMNINRTRDTNSAAQVYMVTKGAQKLVEANKKAQLNNEVSTTNWFKKKKHILVQFKYKSDVKKAHTYFIITICSYIIILPVFVLHFYRSYKGTNDIDWKLYTSFSWLSYGVLIIKSLLSFATNKYYVDALYQAANIRGFRGKFHFTSDGNHRDIMNKANDTSEDNRQNFVENQMDDETA